MEDRKMIPCGWHEVSLADVTRAHAFGPRFSSDLYSPNGQVGSIRTTDLNEDGQINYGTIPYANIPVCEIKDHILQTGDLLITRSGTCGVPCIFESQEKPIVAGAFLIRFQMKPDFDASFLHALLKSGPIQREILSMASGGVQKNLTGTNLLKLRLPLPPLPEQKTIASILDTWGRASQLIEELIAANLKQKLCLLQQLHGPSKNPWGKHKLGELFRHRKTRGADGLPTYSVTINNGLVRRDSLERKNDTSLRPDEHLLIEKDDIAYNMMRMWQGASGLASESGLVSPAYVVLRSRGDVDPVFASYWFKTPRVIKKFQDYSHGLTKDRLRLYYKDFASISLPVPPLELQRKIARTLASCDRELDLLRRKLDLLKKQKKGLMQQLLTGKVRVKLPEGVA